MAAAAAATPTVPRKSLRVCMSQPLSSWPHGRTGKGKVQGEMGVPKPGPRGGSGTGTAAPRPQFQRETLDRYSRLHRDLDHAVSPTALESAAAVAGPVVGHHPQHVLARLAEGGRGGSAASENRGGTR